VIIKARIYGASLFYASFVKTGAVIALLFVHGGISERICTKTGQMIEASQDRGMNLYQVIKIEW